MSELKKVNLKHVFTYQLKLGRIDVLGPTPEGVQGIAQAAGGEFSGPHLSGKILPFGGDAFITRPDGVHASDVRLLLETHDKTLIYLTFQGVMDLKAQGNPGGPEKAVPQVHGAIRLRSGHPKYEQLNRRHFVGVITSNPEKMEARGDIYRLD